MAVDAQGYIIKTDPYDVGVRMKPAVPGTVYEHPENVYSDAPKRGDYAGRAQPRIHYRSGHRNVFGEYVVDGRAEAPHG